MEAIDFARQLWKEFNLNKSRGAGMTCFENGEIIKQHGKATDTDDLKEMGDTIVHYKPVQLKLKGK